jgi:hypothetical protein
MQFFIGLCYVDTLMKEELWLQIFYILQSFKSFKNKEICDF